MSNPKIVDVPEHENIQNARTDIPPQKEYGSVEAEEIDILKTVDDFHADANQETHDTKYQDQRTMIDEVKKPDAFCDMYFTTVEEEHTIDDQDECLDIDKLAAQKLGENENANSRQIESLGRRGDTALQVLDENDGSLFDKHDKTILVRKSHPVSIYDENIQAPKKKKISWFIVIAMVVMFLLGGGICMAILLTAKPGVGPPGKVFQLI